MRIAKVLSFLLVAILLSLLGITVSAAGNTMQTATPISLNTSYSGEITATNKIDYYTFTLPSSGRVNVRVTAYIYETNYYIYDVNGNKVWEKKYQYWNSTSNEFNLDENVDLTSGTYYFAVEQASGTGNYNFMRVITTKCGLANGQGVRLRGRRSGGIWLRSDCQCSESRRPSEQPA